MVGVKKHLNTKELFLSEPYRVFFILGLIMAAIASAVWILFYFQVLKAYPIFLHSRLMIMGFLLAFVMGFLMTAVPRMTQTGAASSLEKGLGVFFMISFFISALLEAWLLNSIFAVCNLALLVVFFLKRKMQTPELSLPKGFIFIPLGLLTGLLGGILTSLSYVVELSSALLHFAKLLSYQGFLLNLIVGLGSRLIPVLAKREGAMNPMETKGLTNSVYIVQALALNASFVVESFLHREIGLALRLLLFIYVVVFNFKLTKPTIEKSFLAWGLTLSGMMFPLSFLFLLFAPYLEVFFLHLLYVGGFALLTFLISIRVSLAHGGGLLNLERSSPLIPLLTIGFLLAAAFRVFANQFGTGLMFAFYAFAAAFFMLSLLFWWLLVGRYLLRKGAGHG